MMATTSRSATQITGTFDEWKAVTMKRDTITDKFDLNCFLTKINTGTLHELCMPVTLSYKKGQQDNNGSDSAG